MFYSLFIFSLIHLKTLKTGFTCGAIPDILQSINRCMLNVNYYIIAFAAVVICYIYLFVAFVNFLSASSKNKMFC